VRDGKGKDDKTATTGHDQGVGTIGHALDSKDELTDELIEKIVKQEEKDLLVHTVPACNPVEVRLSAFSRAAVGGRQGGSAARLASAAAAVWAAACCMRECFMSDHSAAAAAAAAACGLQVLFWVQIVIKRLSLLSRKIAGEEGTKNLKGIEPPLEGQFYAMIEKIETLFASMELIDRTQFPFPYSQIMKILLYFWILALPFVLADSCGASTPAVMVLIGIGFFGLDEVPKKSFLSHFYVKKIQFARTNIRKR
jgi:hypothetical protein